MSKPLSAKEALALAKLYAQLKYNAQQEFYLKKIENVAQKGGTFIIVNDDFGYCLFDEDYAAFEELGYKVVRPALSHMYGRIHWNE